MTDTEEEAEGWTLNDADRRVLKELCYEIRMLTTFARSGYDLIGIGEAWHAMESILEGDDIEVNVGISLGVRDGDETFQEGRSVDFRIDWEGIVLDELNTSYEAGVGSDRYTVPHATLGPSGDFDSSAVAEWIEVLDEMRRDGAAKLNVWRDHV